jgi:hypothetical protein
MSSDGRIIAVVSATSTTQTGTTYTTYTTNLFTRDGINLKTIEPSGGDAALSGDGSILVESGGGIYYYLTEATEKAVESQITFTKNAIDTNSQYNQEPAKAELQRAEQFFSSRQYSDAYSSAKIAYTLASDVDQDGIPNNHDIAPTIPNIWIYSTISIIIVFIVVCFLFDFLRCKVRTEITLTTPDVYEGEEATTGIKITVLGNFYDLSCPVTLDGKPGQTINQPGKYEIPWGILLLGSHTAMAECMVRQIRYGRKTISSKESFNVKPVVPEINVNADPCECFERDSATASVTLTNNSPFPAVFPEFRLEPGQSRTLQFPIEAAAAPGILEKTERLAFTNTAGRSFSIEIPLWCTVKAVVPAIEPSTGDVTCREGEEPAARITVRNTSLHEAIFDRFALKPGEERVLEIVLQDHTIGRHIETHTIQFRNRLGKNFERRIDIPYIVSPVEPVITGSSEAYEILEGDKGSIQIILKNTSEFDAIFSDFTIRPAESKTITIPADTRIPGDIRFTYMAMYKNSAGREFSREIPVSYHVEAREPAITASVVPVKECFEGDPLSASVTLSNASVHEAIFSSFILKKGESQMITVALNTSRVGEKTVVYTAEYRNSVGRVISQDIPIRYTVLPVPRPSVILVSDIREGLEGSIRIEITNASPNVLERFRVTLETPEDLQIKDKTVEMRQIGPGERRSISFRVFAPFGGDYSVRAGYSYAAAGRIFEQHLASVVTVTSPPLSSASSEATHRTPSESKAMKARMPAQRSASAPPSNAVTPLSSVTEGTKCQVCLTEFSSAEPGAVKCPHCGSEFHYRCITKWVNRHGTCPICKKELRV